MLKKGRLLVYIDESGTPDYFFPHKHLRNESVYTISAVCIWRKDYKKLKRRIKSLKRSYKQYLIDKEIKSYWIRHSNPIGKNPSISLDYNFNKYANGVKKYNDFCDELRNIFLDTELQIISVSIKKDFAQLYYPHFNHFQTVLVDFWERVCIFHITNKVDESRIIFDPTGKVDDKILIDSYRRFLEDGSMFIKPSEYEELQLYNRLFPVDSHLSIGIQIADLVAYPIKRHVLNPNSYKYFNEVVSKKLARNVSDRRTGKTIYLGLKQTLSR